MQNINNIMFWNLQRIVGRGRSSLRSSWSSICRKWWISLADIRCILNCTAPVLVRFPNPLALGRASESENLTTCHPEIKDRQLSEICSLASGCTAGRAGQGFRRPLLPPLRCHFSSAIKSRSEEIQQFFAQEQDLFKIQCVNILLISNNKIYQQYQNPPQSCARHKNRGRNSGLTDS